MIRNPHLSSSTAAGGASDVAAEWDRGNDQWWDWYMSLAADGPAPAGPLVDPPPHDPGPLPSDAEVAAELAEPYPITEAQVRRFASDSFIKLTGVLTTGAVERLRGRLRTLLDEAVDPAVGFQSRE